MILKYQAEINSWYSEAYDKNEYEIANFEYEVEWGELLPVIIDIIYERHFKALGGDEIETKRAIESMVCEIDGDAIEETYRYELTEYFYKKAMMWYTED